MQPVAYRPYARRVRQEIQALLQQKLTWDRQMSVSLGKGVVIARVNSCPGKEADHSPGWVRDER